MAAARSRRVGGRTEYWPSFVDVLTNLLLVFVFLLSIFALTQFLLTREVSSRDEVLARLNAQIAELTELLALERAGNSEVNDNLSTLQASLAAAETERDRLRGLLDSQSDAAANAGGRVQQLTDQLESEQQVSQRALAQVELLNQQISALRRQIAALETALDASEDRDRESQTKIADLGRRLNVALAQRVQELSRYRSDFFGRLREILGDRPDIRIVGDRFVFQSEVFFQTGSDDIGSEGLAELDKLAAAIVELNQEIPEDIPWVLRIDGHTDKRPITSSGGRFQSNWDLSAARAISVVRHLIDQGIPPERLVAAGFGEYQPIEEGDTEEAYAKNRRIELKLTER
ncbi:MAG: peptidoglycan -binding protein [Bauldia sp.]|uniref:peptidoglycan -binding protein n=1 Tax=Bauldia sp. TaxID=2575872 RepID=UPI001DA5C8DE|nr:peptidoglycan -binding protein [Bauldia sp.]MCB1496122.1 peptidoglycan -binding protein [Bauldia sp.]